MGPIITPDGKVVVLKDDGTWSYGAASGSILERWKSVRLPPDLVEPFRQVFQKLGVRILDTGETLTCLHRGDRIEFRAGIGDAVDATVAIYSYQAERLAQQIERGRLAPIEWFRIARALLPSSAGATDRVVDSPLSSSPMLRRFIRAKNLVHVYLVSPEPAEEPDAVFTLIHVNRHSLLVPGLHGAPERVFRLTVADTLDLLRTVSAGRTGGGLTTWFKIARWYIDWRKRVEVRT